MPPATASKAKAAEATHAMSLAVVKNLVRTAVATVAYTRDLFPEKCFSKHKIRSRGSSGGGDDSVTVRLLQPRTPESAYVRSWIEGGVFDALGKGVLDELVLGIHADRSRPHEPPAEAYRFRVSYADAGGVSLSHEARGRAAAPPSSTTIHSSTTAMVRTLVTLSETFQPVDPEARFITMQIYFREGFEPSDDAGSYQPLFFRAADPAKDPEAPGAGSTGAVTCGSVRSSHHDVALTVCADELRDEAEEDQKQAAEAGELAAAAEEVEVLGRDAFAEESPSTPHTPEEDGDKEPEPELPGPDQVASEDDDDDASAFEDPDATQSDSEGDDRRRADALLAVVRERHARGLTSSAYSLVRVLKGFGGRAAIDGVLRELALSGRLGETAPGSKAYTPLVPRPKRAGTGRAPRAGSGVSFDARMDLDTRVGLSQREPSGVPAATPRKRSTTIEPIHQGGKRRRVVF